MRQCLHAVRRKVISKAIEESEKFFEQKDTNRVTAKLSSEYSSAEQMLFKFFKIPSEKAMKHGKARMRYEDLVRRVERKLYEVMRASSSSSEGVADRTENLAKELFRQPGRLLTSQELVDLYALSGCRDLVTAPNCTSATLNQYRTIDGTCNNLQQTLYGAASTPFRRILSPYYEDGISNIRGNIQNYENVLPVGPFLPPNPSPRLVSSTIVRDRPLDDASITHMLMQWGQFLDHDITFSPGLSPNCGNCQKTDVCIPILVPRNDEAFGAGTLRNGQCIPFSRSVPVCTAPPQGMLDPRQQINDITSFIDGSMIYGSTLSVADSLRQFRGGLLRVSSPTSAVNSSNSSSPTSSVKFNLPFDSNGFLAGDTRVNEHTALTVMHTIWLREHNRIANLLAQVNPIWDDENIYQETRKIVGAEIQKITYYEFLPVVLGQNWFNKLIQPYSKYDSSVDPSILSEFAAAAFRFGHSLVRPSFPRLDRFNQPMGDLNLLDSFGNPSAFTSSLGTDPILRGLLVSNSRRRDEFVTNILTDHLFEAAPSSTGWGSSPGAPGLDLAALNIQRGRDHGLPPYPIVKEFCKNFYGISSAFQNDVTTIRFLQTYGSMDTADLWVGGLSEENLPSSIIGATFACILANTFRNLRDGDRFYFENPSTFTSQQFGEIMNKSSLSKVICENSDEITQIQKNAFLAAQPQISCSSLPSINFNYWKTGSCFVKSNIPARNYAVEIRAYSKSTQSSYSFSTANVSSSATNKFTCIQIQCPTDTAPTSIIMYSTYAGVSIIQNPLLPTNGFGLRELYFATLPKTLLSLSSGVYSTLTACQTLNDIALTFIYPPLTEEQLAEDAEEKSCNPISPDCTEEVPDVVKPIISGNAPPSVNQQASKSSSSASSGVVSKLDEVVDNEELFKELEESLKQI